MTIERNDQDIVIRLNAALFDINDVQKLINHFHFVESNAQNRGTEENAAKLAHEVETSWWAENRHKFLP
ncbi:hypothetical protein [Dyadobacter sp. CY356]|uniref:hypothetical protein n=1 Tax=Dyadobacter sp. CY356 TaxID=2906442 RepID=UPI001F2ED623|nr:hypothetical protein [Dyadobacter sp. CY356]MCF0055562.1 hypothetical protein [Dyadobacter sp. CY356]